MLYLFGGIAFDTEFVFDQLELLGNRVPRKKLSLRFGHIPPIVDQAIHANFGRYGLTWGRSGRSWVFRSRFPDVFTFDPTQGIITCYVTSDNVRAWQDVLFRRVLPRIVVHYGATAVHAAAIAIADRCILLLGRSGAGKSTLTAFCATAGWRILSEDTSLLWFDDSIVIEPVQHGIGIWQDSRDALSITPADCVAMPGYGGRKWSYEPGQAALPHPPPLSAVMMLERSAEVNMLELNPLSRAEAMQALIEQIIPFIPEAHPSATTALSFGRVAALTRQLPSFRLTYPDSYATLPDVEAVLRDVPLDGAAT